MECSMQRIVIKPTTEESWKHQCLIHNRNIRLLKLGTDFILSPLKHHQDYVRGKSDTCILWSLHMKHSCSHVQLNSLFNSCKSSVIICLSLLVRAVSLIGSFWTSAPFYVSVLFTAQQISSFLFHRYWKCSCWRQLVIRDAH